MKEIISVDSIVRKVSDYFYELLKDNLLDRGLNKEEYELKNRNKIKLQMALKNCIYQDKDSKKIVLDKIRSCIEESYVLNENNINQIIDFENSKDLSVYIKYMIILKKYKKSFDSEALSKVISKYKLDDLKKIDGVERYVITEDEINKIYLKEKIKLTFDEKLDILTKIVYEKYKGYGIIDELIDMKIDGISGGVSGDLNSLDSIWIFYEGKYIHMKFLKFDSENELIRICQNIYKFDNPGELSKSSGYKINKMKDGSRVVVTRPDFSESWMFFIRKFETSTGKLDEIEKLEGSENLINILKYIVKGSQNICISGSQGSGKTTMLLNIMEFIYPVYPIRICETAFELSARSRFKDRNICTFQETDNITGQEGLDLSKKTDGVINIIGEVASDEVASQLMQAGQVATKCTIFTHHGKTCDELIRSLRNSLLKTRAFSNEFIAEEQVASVVNFDVHLEKDFYGNRYVERVTECIARSRSEDSKITYELSDIIVFCDGKYVVKNNISNEKIKNMRKEMTYLDREEFDKFVDMVSV